LYSSNGGEEIACPKTYLKPLEPPSVSKKRRVIPSPGPPNRKEKILRGEVIRPRTGGGRKQKLPLQELSHQVEPRRSKAQKRGKADKGVASPPSSERNQYHLAKKKGYLPSLCRGKEKAPPRKLEQTSLTISNKNASLSGGGGKQNQQREIEALQKGAWVGPPHTPPNKGTPRKRKKELIHLCFLNEKKFLREWSKRIDLT